MNKCLYCYKELYNGERDFHPSCSMKFFGVKEPPVLEYRRDDLDSLASKIIQAQTSLTGVQPKLSLNLSKHNGCNRLTIVGLWGDYIFKPQTDSYPQLPENEDLTMKLAEALRIKTVPHSLIRLSDGSLGYITRRIDRSAQGEKIDMEDMCQLTCHPTEYKYKGSSEQIAKTITAFSDTPKLDIVNFMQILLFSFVTGNNDMHLKNFSIYRPKHHYQLAPAYDLLNVSIANPKDGEELALPLAGKKSNLKYNDFIKASTTMGIDEKVTVKMIEAMRKTMPIWDNIIKESFLSDDLKEAYISLIRHRLDVLTPK